MSDTCVVDFTGQVGVTPRIVRITTLSSFAIVTAANFLDQFRSQGFTFYQNDIFAVAYGTNSATSNFFTMDSTGTLVPGDADVVLPVVSGNLAKFSGTSGAIADTLIAASSVILNSVAAGQAIAATSSSATPSVTALANTLTLTGTPITSGTSNGLTGAITMVAASGGTLSGVKGTATPTGAITSTAVVAAVNGTLVLTGATINAGTVAGIYADWGSAAGTATDLTKCSGFKFVNGSANKLNSQFYASGNATYAFEFVGTNDFEVAAGTSAGSAGNSTHCAAQEVLTIRQGAAVKYIPVFTQNS